MEVGSLVQSKAIPSNIGIVIGRYTYGLKTNPPYMVRIYINGKIKWSNIKYFKVINES